MNIREISKPVTAKVLNESLAKRFGQKITLEKFTLEQLQDFRNKIRTTLSQVETNESFEAINSSAVYQKNKLFLDVLNAEIAEREDVQEEAVSTAQQQAAGAALAVKRGERPRSSLTGASLQMVDMSEKELEKIAGTKHAGLPKHVDEGSKPDFLDLDKDGNKKEPMKKAAKDAKKKKTDESIVTEGAEDQAELVMAAKDMVDRITGWMEDTAEMQTESMLELADAIRDEMGQQQSEQFVSTVKPALEALYSAMETTRQALTSGVGQLTGEAEPTDMMGAPEGEEEPAMEPTIDMEEPPAEDDGMSTAPAAAGGEEEAGRAKRESVERKRKVLETSRRIAALLSKKK